MKQDNLFTEKFLEELQKWEDFVPQEFFSWLFKNLGLAHRAIHLKNHPHDKGNGFYQRNLQIGGLSFPVEIARTRYEKFRPFFLPPGHTRYLPEDYLNLAFSFLLGARSIQSASRALQNIDLPFNQDYLDEVIEEFVTYLETLNSSPLPSDLAAIFLDGKSIRQKVKEGKEVREYTTYVALGLTLEGQKLILGLYTFEGQESQENWKKVLEKLIQRGLRRILIVVHDDFPGLSSLTEAFFPRADIQLCTVHLLRNARKHLSREHYRTFRDYFQSIKNSLNYEEGLRLFEALLEKLPQGLRFVKRVANRKERYLAFLKYPKELRPLFSSTNLAEGLNRKIEEAERACGGYFHSERDRNFRYGVLAKELLEGRWRRPNWKYREIAHLLRCLFEERFSKDDH
ncbi:IS256 family transposase [Thermosulfurimonas dismutans]|uniref:Mutator family transposase n=1 Tax=Thermosulfurimonas dismutans TaxID=999894 RepID=A0A179D3I7_9BACT|nr:transposase [Thermosulfurimonas dismutans]OAQ20606.1 Mobile element protein [Thermosulfurimonas dismutans]